MRPVEMRVEMRVQTPSKCGGELQRRFGAVNCGCICLRDLQQQGTWLLHLFACREVASGCRLLERSSCRRWKSAVRRVEAREAAR